VDFFGNLPRNGKFIILLWNDLNFVPRSLIFALRMLGENYRLWKIPILEVQNLNFSPWQPWDCACTTSSEIKMAVIRWASFVFEANISLKDMTTGDCLFGVQEALLFFDLCLTSKFICSEKQLQSGKFWNIPEPYYFVAHA